MANQTKSQRLAEKTASGLSQIEAEIEIAREDMEAKIAGLQAKQRKQEARVRETLLDLLETEEPELFERFRAAAQDRLEQEARRRRERAQGPRVTPSAERADASDDGRANGLES